MDNKGQERELGNTINHENPSECCINDILVYFHLYSHLVGRHFYKENY